MRLPLTDSEQRAVNTALWLLVADERAHLALIDAFRATCDDAMTVSEFRNALQVAMTKGVQKGTVR